MGACLELVGDLVLGNGLLLNSFRVCHAGLQGKEQVWRIEIPKCRLQQSPLVVSSPQTIPDRQTSNSHADCPLTVTNIPSGCCPFMVVDRNRTSLAPKIVVQSHEKWPSQPLFILRLHCEINRLDE